MTAENPRPNRQEQQSRPGIDSIGKAVANDALIYFLISQLNEQGALPIVMAKISELKCASEVSVEKTLERYGPAEVRRYGNVETYQEVRSQLEHLVTVRKQRSGLVEIQDIDVGAII